MNWQLNKYKQCSAFAVYGASHSSVDHEVDGEKCAKSKQLSHTWQGQRVKQGTGGLSWKKE